MKLGRLFRRKKPTQDQVDSGLDAWRVPHASASDYLDLDFDSEPVPVRRRLARGSITVPEELDATDNVDWLLSSLRSDRSAGPPPPPPKRMAEGTDTFVRADAESDDAQTDEFEILEEDVMLLPD